MSNILPWPVAVGGIGHSGEKTMSFKPTMMLSLAGMLLTIANTASAIDGRTAVGLCIDVTANGTRCGWSVNEIGEIDICTRSGCVYCASAEAECVVAHTVADDADSGGQNDVSGTIQDEPVAHSETEGDRSSGGGSPIDRNNPRRQQN